MEDNFKKAADILGITLEESKQRFSYFKQEHWDKFFGWHTYGLTVD